MPGLVLDTALGRGTFGAVWRGLDLGTGETVAVRVGRPAGGAEAVAREGALLRRLRHENVLHLRSVVDLADGTRGLVVDLLPGGSLAELAARRGSLPPGEVATIAVAVARALQHLHTHGLVHGRLSGRDVLFAADGRPVVTDVGLATLLAGDGPGGAVRYPAPADDVLALGELLAGALTGGDPDLLGDLGGPLADLAASCLAPDPAARPTPDRVAQLARRAVAPLPVDLAGNAPVATVTPAAPLPPGWRPLPGRPAPPARPATHLAHPVAAPPRRPAPTVAAPPDPDAGPRGRRRVVVVAAGALTAAGLTVGAVTLALRTDPPAPAAAPAPSAPAAPAAPAPSDVEAVVGQLAAARAAAFASASERALARVDAPGSTALEQDRAVVRRLTDAGVRLQGLRFTVGGVRVVAVTGQGVTVEARVATSAHRQVRRDGTVARTVPAQPARRVQLTLVRLGNDWRVSAVV